MKKEYLVVTAIFLFFLSYVLDFLAGKVSISVATPMDYFTPAILTKYPLTTVEILSRAAGLVISIVVILDELEQRPFIKSAILMVLAMLAGFYAVQQLATKGTITPFQWTLAFAYAAGGSVPIVFLYIIKGILRAMFGAFGGGKKEEMPQQAQENTNV